MRDLHERLTALFPIGASIDQRPDLGFIDVPRASLIPLLSHLREREGYTHLVLLTAVDWLEAGEFQLTYLLCNRAIPHDLGVRVRIPREPAAMDSIHTLWPTAATYQRELREMFGIDFPGSPGVNDEFILEGWTGPPPYRRDFDTLAYSRDTFREREGRVTHDPAGHMKERLYPEGGPR